MLESLFNKVAGLKACNFIKKRLQHRCFPVNIAKFLRTSFFTEYLRWLLLHIVSIKLRNIFKLSPFHVTSLFLYPLKILYLFYKAVVKYRKTTAKVLGLGSILPKTRLDCGCFPVGLTRILCTIAFL